MVLVSPRPGGSAPLGAFYHDDTKTQRLAMKGESTIPRRHKDSKKRQAHSGTVSGNLGRPPFVSSRLPGRIFPPRAPEPRHPRADPETRKDLSAACGEA